MTIRKTLIYNKLNKTKEGVKMATQDLRRADVKMNRGAGSSVVSQTPEKFDLLVSDVAEDITYLGEWVEIAVFDADFPDDATSIVIGIEGASTGINLSSLNGKLAQGYRIPGFFSSITIPTGSLMQLIAFRF